MIRSGMIEFYTFRFPKGHEHEDLYPEFLPETDDSVTMFASMYPHPIAETLAEAKAYLGELIESNEDMVLDIVKITQQIESVL